MKKVFTSPMKLLLVISSGSFMAVLVAVLIAEFFLQQKLNIPSPYPIVESLPQHTHTKKIEAFSGPPPWQQPRPEEVFNFPITYGDTGPSDSLFSGPKQYPFLCQSLESGLGQPIVDNQDGYGTPVFQENSSGEITSTVIGYSKDCSLPTRWQLKQFKDEKLFIRIETGTINRFIYALLIPTTSEDTEQAPDFSQWNGALIYHFKGAIGIGYQQGKLRLNRIIRDMKPALKKGYAIAFSTGNETDNHYNITLQEDTALRVKQQFIRRYGQPKYTIGFGDSGGALQQYLLSQNNPTLLQAGVAVDAYPDMVSQITYGLDCPLLEYYFDYLAADKTFWHKAQHRSWVSGLSFNNNYTPRGEWLERLTNWLRFNQHPKRSGATECNYAWRGSVQLVNNPRFNSHHARYSDKVLNDTHWSHWQDNQFIYGTDEHGYAQIPWSNVGVQYGLQAWKRGHINAEHFFDLNQKIGSWLPQKELQPENFWLLSQQKSLFSFSPYQTENFSHKGKALNSAPRIPGSHSAAIGAYNGGHIFTGRLNMPLIDVRRYRDDILDIHHSWSAISSRQRIIHHDKSDASRQSTAYHSIWIADKSFKQAHWLALEAIEQWLSPGSVNSVESVAKQNMKPSTATDRCFDKDGQVIANGHSVWDGEWNQRPDGHCTQRFPFFRSSRQVAGESAAATILFCQRISIDDAITAGIYSPLNITAEYRTKLQSIFPQGVCDYSKPDSAAQ
ncbi:DUF6351 family protein [Bacterioplanoides sp. SCSIO 12839]|uniref:DUF6351 family protein n=1 Tax=Bacterioplanoides sp. SCSIO 12839 TaxID=2829569 RepID=UPI0021021977|nr:DUF6351 family protein [Bacterioplanoides sp. SCSIO 12839]UTW49926.1 hypothetical protein KFF03_08610 [Bacterioplanoides sp. SCSIO 12839]